MAASASPSASTLLGGLESIAEENLKKSTEYQEFTQENIQPLKDQKQAIQGA